MNIMIHAKEILEAINEGDFAGIGPTISEYFSGVCKNGHSLKEPLLKEYNVSVFRFLHAICSLKEPATDIGSIKSVLQVCIQCCVVYVEIQRQTDIDKQCGVPKLLYHILSKYKGKHSVDEIYTLTKLLYEMFPSDEQSSDGIKVIKAVYLLLWNFVCKIVPKDLTGAGQLQGQIFNLLGICLKFVTLLGSQTLLLNRLKDITSLFLTVETQKDASSSDDDNKGKEDSQNEICEVLQVINAWLKNGLDSGGDHDEIEKDKSHRNMLHIQCLLTIWYMKMSMYGKAREILSNITETNWDTLKILSSILLKTLTFVMCLDETLRGASTEILDKCITNLEFVNQGLNSIKCDNLDDLWILHRCQYIFMQLLNKKFFQFFKGHFTWCNVKIFLQCCDGFALICTDSIKQLTLNEQKPGTDGENKNDLTDIDKKKQDYVGKLYSNRLSVHYKKLELLHQIVQESLDAENESEVLDTVLETATNYTTLLTEDSSEISDKVLNTEKYQISYICATIGKLLSSRCHYTYAGPLLKISGHHLQQNSIPKAVRQFELSVDCYCKQELYDEASQVILEMVEMGTEAVEPAISAWTKVKQAAIETGETHLSSVSFHDLLGKSGITLDGYTGRDLLVLEYKNWKKLSERNFDIEFVLLGKMTQNSSTKVHKAEVMIELSSNLFLTGETFEERSPGEILTKAITLLDKCKENTKMTLAMANYRKFLVNHEEIVQHCRSTILFEKDKKNKESLGSTRDQNEEIGNTKEFKYETPFSLESEQSNLPYLTRAIQLWESAFKEGVELDDLKKSKRSICLYELELHLDTMISCGTRLIAMKQPSNALKVLKSAYGQIKNITDKKQASDLTMKTSQALMLLGQFDESEQMIGSINNREDSTNFEKLLLMAELFLRMGKKSEGMSLVHKVLQEKKSDVMTSKTCLIMGTAKRLLSMFLCCPEGHKVTQVKQDILSLATDAVKQHITVLRYEIATKANSKIQDKKWVLMFEFFQSLLHMCQLYRYTGLARMAEGFQNEGIKMSQEVGLPLWSCEFMFEALRTHAMQVDTTKTLAAINSIKSILDTNGVTENHRMLVTKQSFGLKDCPESVSRNSQNGIASDSQLLCEPVIDGIDSSPQKGTQQDLESSQREQLSKLTVPECRCMKNKSTNDCDINVHRLFVKAGIVISDFLVQYDMESVSNRVLSELQIKYPKYFSSFEDSCKENQNGSLQMAIENTDPQFKFLSLEAMCLQAESLLSQKKFDKVQKIWSVLHSFQNKGFWNNVVHSDVLMSRVALCQASSIMFSVQLNSNTVLLGPSNEIQDTKNHLDCNSSKKVGFADLVSSIPIDWNRKLDELDTENIDPIKNVCSNNKKPMCDRKSVLTPLNSKINQDVGQSSGNMMGKLILSAKKQKLTQVLGTPLTSRKTKLEFLMESDDDESVVFPASKPVTPKTNKSGRKNRLKSRQGQNSVDELCTDSNHDKFDATDDDNENVVFPETKLVTPKSLKPKRKKQVRSRSAQNSSEELSKLGHENEISNTNDSDGVKAKLFEKPNLKAKSSPTNTDTTVGPSEDKAQTSKRTGRKKKCDTEVKMIKLDTEIPDCQVLNLNEDTEKESEHITESIICDKTKAPTSKTSTSRNRIPRSKKSSVEGSKEANTPGKSLIVKDAVVIETDSTSSLNSGIPEMSGKSNAKCNNQKLSLKGKKNARINGITEIKHTELKKDNELDTLLVNGKDDDKSKKYSVLESKGDAFDFICTPEKPNTCNTRKAKAVKSSKNPSQTGAKAGKAEKSETKSSRKTAETNKDSSGIKRGGRRLRNDVETVRSVEKHTTEQSTDSFFDISREFEYILEVDNEESDESVISKLEDIQFELNSPEPFDSPQNYISIINIPQEELVIFDENDCADIEIMRSGRRPRGKMNKTEKVPTEQTMTRKGSCNEVEVVRSGDSVNMKLLMDRMSLDCNIDISASEATEPMQENQAIQQEQMMELLEDLCGRIRHIAPYPQYPQMCQVLASKYVNTNPRKAAYLLSESIAVSFRHHAAIVRNNAKHSGQSTRMSRDSLFSGNVSPVDSILDKDENSLQMMTDSIPSDWCIVQMSVISDLLQRQHFLITRLAKGKEPVVIEVPAFSTPQGRCVLKDFEKVHDRNRSTKALTDKIEWWKQRMKINTDLKEVIDSMEKFWIGPWKGVFMPPISDDNTILSLQKEIKKCLKMEIESSKLEMILLSQNILTDVQLQYCVRGLLGSGFKESDLTSVIAIVNNFTVPDVEVTSQHHIVLILDKTVQHLPWECLPTLSERSVSRMPCLSHLYYQLSYLTKQESSIFVKGANPKSLFYIVNPDGDLANTEEQFKDWFKSEEGWKGICGTKPTKEQFSEALTEKDIMVYLGHGSGGRYFPGVEIEKLQGHAVTVLMGCSSGKLLVKGQLEPFGIMTSYFLAGCPCMVANLWDVTDKDIDKYTMELLKTWLNSEDGSPLIPCVQRARKACKMKYLVGSAPVVYGLPVFINRKGT